MLEIVRVQHLHTVKHEVAFFPATGLGRSVLTPLKEIQATLLCSVCNLNPICTNLNTSLGANNPSSKPTCVLLLELNLLYRTTTPINIDWIVLRQPLLYINIDIPQIILKARPKAI